MTVHSLVILLPCSAIFPEGSVDMLFLLTGLLYVLCEGCESEQNNYELCLPTNLMYGEKLMGPNGQSL